MDYPWIESIDHIQGTAPVPFRVRLAPRTTRKIIAVPFSMTVHNCDTPTGLIWEMWGKMGTCGAISDVDRFHTLAVVGGGWFEQIR